MATNNEELQGYVERYRKMAEKINTLNQIAVRQFLGSRPADDPRVVYLVGMENFRNLANAQLEVLVRLATEKLGVKKEEFLQMYSEEMEKQVKDLEEDLRVSGWDGDGQPIFDLQAYRERTIGWPP